MLRFLTPAGIMTLLLRLLLCNSIEGFSSFHHPHHCHYREYPETTFPTALAAAQINAFNDDDDDGDDWKDPEILSRRQFWTLASLAGASGGVLVSLPPMARAASTTSSSRYILDEETGDYVEVEDEDWQTVWRQRLDKAQSMSTQEIFQAARGAGNVDLRKEESSASQKRRAMSACRDANLRQKANAGSERDCTARVFSGEVEFMLNQL
eukprot:scaffold1340_cov122-Cylindrotheca_fusiformis.AAC.21